MAKAKTIYSCTECGGQVPKWQGQCPHCTAWNTLVESVAETAVAGKNRYSALATTGRVQTLAEVDAEEVPRTPTGIVEFDRVLGGGLVQGGVVLIGGDPGIGKSTLLLQTLAHLSTQKKVLYVSGEESAQQIALRAKRLALDARGMHLLAEIQLEKIQATIAQEKPDVVVIDSIQTVYSEQLTSAPGSVAQVRECAAQLTRTAKGSALTMILVGHVTKEGTLAGPRVLEHIVDTVLYFEGDKGHSFRILRAVKNRFGSTNEIGVFEMKESGLAEVANPSEIFLAERPADATGSVVVSSLEGSRPILAELQALVASSKLAMPRRTCIGVDYNRVSLLLAVLEKRVGMHLMGMDVFVNIVGGLKIDEPAVDLGIVAAVASSFRERPIAAQTVVMGEVGLAGEVRAISQAEARIKDAAKLGFKRCVLPALNVEKMDKASKSKMELLGVRSVDEAMERLF